MKPFSKQVRDARRLLDYAISEGTKSNKVDEPIIRAINRAEESINQSRQPVQPQDDLLSQRVDFEIAYRDLIAFLNPVTKQTILFSYVIMTYIRYGIILLACLLIIAKYTLAKEMFKEVPTYLFILYTILTLLIVWFIDLFTGILTKRRIIEIIMFCYLFTFVSMVILLIPVFMGTDDRHFYRNLADGPIAFMRGCNRQIDDSWITEELKCTGNKSQIQGEKQNFQWVISIGGASEISQIMASTKAQPAADTSTTSTPPILELSPTGSETEDNDVVYRIYGGVVLPIYVVFLSLLGGVVSMTRRVPEYQRCVYLPEGSPGYLSKEKARELLIFQIMQVISAPLIAITLYYLVKPGNITTSVLLSFTAGFASESVLLAIRALGNRLNNAMGQGNTSPLANHERAEPSSSPQPSSQGER